LSYADPPAQSSYAKVHDRPALELRMEGKQGQTMVLVLSPKELPMNSQASSRGVGEPSTGAVVKNMVWPPHELPSQFRKEIGVGSFFQCPMKNELIPISSRGPLQTVPGPLQEVR